MRKTRFSKVLALTLVFVMLMSSVASAAPGRVISNTLRATFNVVEEDKVAEAIAAVNAATDVTSVREAFQTYSSVLGIDEAIMEIFNAMPEDQGRQLAVRNAVKMFTYETTAEIKTVFEGSVNKEHAKMIFIKAVDEATNTDDMVLALGGPLKDIHANRQNLIAQLKLEVGYEALVSELENSTYTKVLVKVNGMSNDELTSLAKALFAKRAEADGGKFFGVEKITNAIDEILTITNIANVSTETELREALLNEQIETINITDYISGISKRLEIRREVTINGQDKTLSFTDAINTASSDRRQGILVMANGVTINDLTVNMTHMELWQGVYGIQGLKVKNLVLNNVTASGADGGILVNGSEVKLTGTIDVSGNESGGIQTGMGTGVVTEPLLDVTGVTTFTNSSEAYGLPTIWEDKVTGTVITNTDQFTINDNVKENQVQYYLDANMSINPEDYITLTTTDFTGTIDAIAGQEVVVNVTAKVNHPDLFKNPVLTVSGIENSNYEISNSANINVDSTDPQEFTITFIFSTTGKHIIDIYVVEAE